MELQVGYLKLKMQGCSPLEQQQRSALRGNFLPLGSGELLIASLFVCVLNAVHLFIFLPTSAIQFNNMYCIIL